MKFRSLGERYLAQLLTEHKIQYVFNCEFDWSLNFTYDYFLYQTTPMILLECMGDQHRVDSVQFNSKALAVQKRDHLKEQLAQQHDMIYIGLVYTQQNLQLLKEEFEAKVLPVLTNKR